MQNKDKGDGIEESPLDMLLVILLEGASSSSPSWREFDYESLNPTSKGERSQNIGGKSNS